MGKRLFQVFDEMNVSDGKNKTRNCAVSGAASFVSAYKVKQGGKITMAVDPQGFDDFLNEKVIPVLVLVNKEEYEKVLNTPQA